MVNKIWKKIPQELTKPYFNGGYFSHRVVLHNSGECTRIYQLMDTVLYQSCPHASVKSPWLFIGWKLDYQKSKNLKYDYFSGCVLYLQERYSSHFASLSYTFVNFVKQENIRSRMTLSKNQFNVDMERLKKCHNPCRVPKSTLALVLNITTYNLLAGGPQSRVHSSQMSSGSVDYINTGQEMTSLVTVLQKIFQVMSQQYHAVEK